MDIAPTILDIMGMDRVESFKGAPVHSTQSTTRGYVISEDLGPGTCDFENKSPRICITKGDKRFLWKSDSSSDRAFQGELYDLSNGIDTKADQDCNTSGNDASINELRKLAEKRLYEIRKTNKSTTQRHQE